ncbi:MAG: 4Fe-4S dicluster domain-containing protein [Xanthomonadales bacterium]|nr:4Fe-4S dicluster domain-containing protein [Xanthomonadales bacterium]MDH4020752.1 4Fe-4S dicluster domain-containing protein [Xanthomonadales bacterium]
MNQHTPDMKGFSRRRFLQGVIGGTGLSVITPSSFAKDPGKTSFANTPSVLVDVTRCIGCRACMRACKNANELPDNTDLSEGFPISWEHQELRFDQWTVVNPSTGANANGDAVTRNIKSQCMHCLEPTCVSVCPVGALTKSELGPILYNADRCIGCRYCIMACPFDIPKYEWHSGLSPVVGKCQFCTRNRLSQGRLPACVESCPTGALKFGRRDSLLFEAKARIDSYPDRYINHIYGEKEAGGTAWLYMSDVPFENLGFKSSVETSPMPPLTWDVLSKIPIVAAAMAGLFGTLAWSLNRQEQSE